MLVFGIKGCINVLGFAGDRGGQGGVGSLELPELDLGLVGQLGDLHHHIG